MRPTTTGANVAAQQANPHSLLWWMKRLMSLRRQHPAFGRGTMEILSPDDRRILAFIRRTDDERLLVVANLSRFARSVELDLGEHAGWRPMELFGRSPFPAIGADGRAALTLAPHAFLWFELTPPRSDDVPARPAAGPPPRLAIDRWASVLDGTKAHPGPCRGGRGLPVVAEPAMEPVPASPVGARGDR